MSIYSHGLLLDYDALIDNWSVVPMVCLYCGHETQVTNSRTPKKQRVVWRRRQCRHCHAVFTTLEKPDWVSAVVVQVKSDYKPLERDKLWLSLYESLKHRPTALRDATALTETILGQASTLIAQGSIERDRLVEITLSILKHFDKVAATHYGAYHKQSTT